MSKNEIELKLLLTKTKLFVDKVASGVPKILLPQMLNEAIKFRSQIYDDYQKLMTPSVKGIVLEHYDNINHNIRTIKFVMTHKKDMIPVMCMQSN